MPIISSIPLSECRTALVRPLGEAHDKPPTMHFIREFFAGHKEKTVLIGIAALLAGLGLIVVDLLTAGVVAPFTAHLTFGLFSFGGAVIGVSVAAKLWSGELPGDTTASDRSGVKKTVIKPRGKRCNRVFQERTPHPPKVPVTGTGKGKGAHQ